MTKPAVEFNDIEMHFSDTIAVSGINLSIQRGSFVVLLGPSGSGKTTLLNLIGGFIEPTKGQVLIDGKNVTGIPPAKRPTTTVFQDYALFPHMSVAGNIAFGLKMRHVPNYEQKKRVNNALELVGLANLGDRRIHEISGGQRQRVALARALVVEPTVLLLDEPLGALDMKLRRQMQEELKAIQKRVGTTFVHVTHDQEEAMAIADTIVIMNNGFIEDQGDPQRIYLKPVSRFTADFMGESNFIDGSVVYSRSGLTTVETQIGRFEVEGTAKRGAQVTLSIRPEHLKIRGKGQFLGSCRVTELGFFGTHYQFKAIIEGTNTSLKVRLGQKKLLRHGSRVKLRVEPADFVLISSL